MVIFVFIKELSSFKLLGDTFFLEDKQFVVVKK
ncbi:hypothetical protein BAPA111461_23370 [Bacillus paramycoides]